MRDGPSWSLGDEAQSLLPVEPIDLVDDAVDVIVHLGAAALDLGIMGEQLGHAFATFEQRRHRHAPALDRLHPLLFGSGGKHSGPAPPLPDAKTREPEDPKGV